jgi:hypothetical protein
MTGSGGISAPTSSGAECAPDLAGSLLLQVTRHRWACKRRARQLRDPLLQNECKGHRGRLQSSGAISWDVGRQLLRRSR